MNIFLLDWDPTKCAEYHCDKHLVKMITEHNQILGSVAYTARGIGRKKDITPEFVQKTFPGFPRKDEEGKTKPYGIAYASHPCTIWAGISANNYSFLCNLTFAMCKEYTKRYGKTHAGEAIAQWYFENMPLSLPYLGITPPAQAMPAECKNSDVIYAYRDYYMKYKKSFAKWAHSSTPDWYIPC